MASEPPFGNVLLSVWEEYRKAAKRSRGLKRRLNRTRAVVLGLVVTGSVLGLSADQSVQWLSREGPLAWLPQGLAVAGAVALAVAAFLGKEVLDSKTEREWVFARSQAEALKSEAYKFMAKASPYDGDDRERRLSDQAKLLLEDEASAAPVRLDEDEKRENLPAKWLSIDDYIRDRVEDQIGTYYEPNALENHAILQRLRLSGFVLGIVGAVLGAIGAGSTSSTWTAGWIAVVGAISGSIAAFAFAGRYQYLSISYELTARRLKALVRDWRLLPEAERPGRAGEFVHNCENAISVENHNWIAEWTKKAKKPNPEQTRPPSAAVAPTAAPGLPRRPKPARNDGAARCCNREERSDAAIQKPPADDTGARTPGIARDRFRQGSALLQPTRNKSPPGASPLAQDVKGGKDTKSKRSWPHGTRRS